MFATLAYNSGQEISYESLSSTSGIAKNTIKRYIEYLEAAFLLVTVQRLDQNAKRFKRKVTQKVYLTNPSMRAALFEPVSGDDKATGSLVETAIFSQWMHSLEMKNIHYARWKGGEVDIVFLHPANQRALWAVEVKWSDRYVEHFEELPQFKEFCIRNRVRSAKVTTKTESANRVADEIPIDFIPSSLYCYTVGKNTVGFETERRMQHTP